MGRILKIGGATVNQTPLDWKGNRLNILAAVEAAKKENIDILCLPELCLTAYGCEDLFLSNWLSETAWEELQQIIPACDGLTVCIGLPVRIANVTYNGVCVIEHKSIVGITLKQNLARDGVHYEPRWFDPWPPGLTKEVEKGGQSVTMGDLVYEHKGIKFGFEICEDAWRQKRPAENLCQRGVDLILNPSASHFALGKSEQRESLVIKSSGEFNCAYVYVNLLGNEAGRMIYDGDIIFAQHGKLLKITDRLGTKPFQVSSCEINFDTPEKSQTFAPTDNKERNEEFTRATTLALFDYLRKSKARGFVLSLSGGADSSTCAVLVSEMAKRFSRDLGWETFCRSLGYPVVHTHAEIMKDLLTCAYQGTKNSSKITFEAARTLADSIGAGFHTWTLDEEIKSFTGKIETAIGRPVSWEQDDIAMQNIQARTRSPIIWMMANVKQAVLLTTSNRSEGDVGYATMDGDTSGSLAPIAGIDKPFIIQWLKWAQQELGYDGLKNVNELQPTAELRPLERSQTDEKDLMPYPILVEIEKLAIRDRKSPLEVFKLMASHHEPVSLKNYVKKFFRLWAANQWKRERLAPSFHLDDLNVDPRSWCRFPILSSGFTKELEALEKHQAG